MTEEILESLQKHNNMLKQQVDSLTAQLETSKEMFNEAVNNVFNLNTRIKLLLKLLNEKDSQLNSLNS